MGRFGALILSSLVVLGVLTVLTLSLWSWRTRHLADRQELSRRMGVRASASRLTREAPEGLLGLFGPMGEWLHLQLEVADGEVRVDRFLMRSGALALGGLMVSMLALDGIGGLAGTLLGLLPLAWVRNKVVRRNEVLSVQLPDALDLIGRSLRAGHAFSEALKVCGDEMPSPIGLELARLSEQNRLGIPMRDALLDLAARHPENFDLRLFASSVMLQRETGGDLIELLTNLSETLRERMLFDRKALALTAEVRTSAAILTTLPFFVAGAILVLRPGYLVPLVEAEVGRTMLTFGVISLVLGVIVMRRLARVEV